MMAKGEKELAREVFASFLCFWQRDAKHATTAHETPTRAGDAAEDTMALPSPPPQLVRDSIEECATTLLGSLHKSSEFNKPPLCFGSALLELCSALGWESKLTTALPAWMGHELLFDDAVTLMEKLCAPKYRAPQHVVDRMADVRARVLVRAPTVMSRSF